MRAYKLFRIKDNVLYPLYVNANIPTPLGKWLTATPGERTEDGKVKSRLGKLSYRPGWHCSARPIALHIGAKANPKDKLPSFRPVNQVWAEVEVMDEVDWQPEADKQGKSPRDKQLKFVPKRGFYEYKTNPNMYGKWIIAGDIKVIRILSDAEVTEINSDIEEDDLPREGTVNYSPNRRDI